MAPVLGARGALRRHGGQFCVSRSNFAAAISDSDRADASSGDRPALVTSCGQARLSATERAAIVASLPYTVWRSLPRVSRLNLAWAISVSERPCASAGVRPAFAISCDWAKAGAPKAGAPKT